MDTIKALPPKPEISKEARRPMAAQEQPVCEYLGCGNSATTCCDSCNTYFCPDHGTPASERPVLDALKERVIEARRNYRNTLDATGKGSNAAYANLEAAEMEWNTKGADSCWQCGGFNTDAANDAHCSACGFHGTSSEVVAHLTPELECPLKETR